MAKRSRYKMPLKRRREGKTDYRERLRLLKSGKVRAVVRPSNKRMRVQFIRYRPEGDDVEAVATSEHLKDLGWEGSGINVPSSYLVGYLAGKRAREKGIDEAVLDIGLNHPEKGGRLFSALKGMVDAGVEIPHDPEVLPPEERMRGEHIDDKVVTDFEEVKSEMEES
ncbi:MAG: 50S ribosomal protein L18 [Candidatus Natronoplasma sp.]